MKAFDYSLFSKYRTTLMGLAILGVMLGHAGSWVGKSTIFNSFAEPFSRLVFTEGFLFLSGLGLYYSYSKNGELTSYYKKRVFRLMIPFAIIAFPFYFYGLLQNGDLQIFLLKESALYFFFYGNNGMWYISVSLLLYLIFPMLYHFMFSSNENNYRRTLIIIGVVILFNYLLHILFNDYYLKVQIGFEKIPMFIAGMYVGYLANEQRKCSVYTLICILFLFIVLYKGKSYISYFSPYSEMLLRVVCMFIICTLLNKYDRNTTEIRQKYDRNTVSYLLLTGLENTP